MPIINTVVSGGGGSPVSADTTMTLPIETSTSENNIEMFNGDFTSTLSEALSGQTRGYKNDAYLVQDPDDNINVVLSKTGVFPVGSFKRWK